MARRQRPPAPPDSTEREAITDPKARNYLSPLAAGVLNAAPALSLPTAIAFHTALLGAAIAWQSQREAGVAALIQVPRESPLPWWAAAVMAAWLLVLGQALLEDRIASLRKLGEELYEAMAPITTVRVAVLAGLSGICEEVLFRGPVQATLGWPVTAVLFALSHGGFSRRHLTWTVFALVAGVLFGVMVEYYQSLSPAIVAHVTVNAINMRRLERYAKRPLPGRP